MLGAGWIVVHAGYHFSSNVARRMDAGLQRLRRAVGYAETKNTRLLLENLNKEPPDAEVHYLAHTVEEWRWYYEKIQSPAFALSFTANHAHLVPEGVAGFPCCDPARTCRRSAARRLFRNGKEEHLLPGQGDFDFPGIVPGLGQARLPRSLHECVWFAGRYVMARRKFAAMP